MAITRSHSALVIRMARLSRAIPALLTTMSRRPRPSTVESIITCAEAGSATSASRVSALTPSARASSAVASAMPGWPARVSAWLE